MGSVFVTDVNMFAKVLQQTKYAQILFVELFKKYLQLNVNGGLIHMIKALLNKHKQIEQYIPIDIPLISLQEKWPGSVTNASAPNGV